MGILKFYWRLLLAAPRALFHGLDLVVTVIAIGVFVLLYIAPDIAKQVAGFDLPGLRLLAGISVVLFVAWRLLKTNYELFAQVERERDRQRDRADSAELLAHTQSVFEVAFDPSDPNCYGSRINEVSDIWGHCRIRVRNRAGRSVAMVRALLLDIESRDTAGGQVFGVGVELPVPLREATDASPQFRTSRQGVTIHPGSQAYFGVAEKLMDEGSIRFDLAVDPRNEQRGPHPLRQYQMSVEVQGLDVMPVNTVVRVWTEGDELRCEQVVGTDDARSQM